MTGLLLSEIILGEPTSVDVTALDIKRFHHQKEFEIEKSVV
jgi:hypothetical protein